MKYLITSVRVLFLVLFLFLLANGKVVIWLILFGVSLMPHSFSAEFIVDMLAQ